jgi:long-chain acyl-CoA synthetase
MEVKRTFDLLERYRTLFPDKDDVLAGKYNGEWKKFSSSDYVEMAHQVSYGLLSMGLKKGDMVATISNNRPEWNIMDMGLSMAGVVHVPIYPTISAEDYDYILNHCEPKFVIVSDKMLLDKIKPIVDKAKSIRDIFTYNRVEGARNWEEILEEGKQQAAKYKGELEKIKSSILPEDLVTLIYTSGTTGFPKGVMLSHNNLVTNFISTAKVHPLDHNCKILSFLPLSHVYERMVNYHFQYKGMSIYFAESMGTIVQNIKEVKPDIFNAVPRLLERVYDGIIGKGKDLPYIKKQIFFWAVNLGLRYDPHHNSGWYNFRLKIADKLIFSKWRAGLGGNIKIIVSGGAALQPRLAHIFWAAGIKVLEGYGLTETSPVIAVNNLNTMEVKFGTVGPLLENIEVKIADDGEILSRGPNTMLGYYKAPDLTAEAIDKEGWFHTGDIGIFVDGKYLKITDRKKEMFKLSSGKYIAPQVLENKLKESFFIENAMVVGENEKFASAIISPNYEFLHNWATIHNVKYRDNSELIKLPEVIKRFQKEVNEINKTVGQTEQIKRFRLVVDEWSPNTGEMSPTLKLKRKVLNERYAEVLKEIYSVDKGD